MKDVTHGICLMQLQRLYPVLCGPRGNKETVVIRRLAFSIRTCRCSNCGSPRVFEFQILPQLLYFFDKRAVSRGDRPPSETSEYPDFATIAIYSCSISCSTEKKGEHIEEYAFVQKSPLE